MDESREKDSSHSSGVREYNLRHPNGSRTFLVIRARRDISVDERPLVFFSHNLSERRYILVSLYLDLGKRELIICLSRRDP